MEIRAIFGWARCDMNSPVSSTSIQRRSWRSPVESNSALLQGDPSARFDRINVQPTQSYVLSAAQSASPKSPPSRKPYPSSNVTPAASTQRVVHPGVVDRLPAVELLALAFGYQREPRATITGEGRPVLGNHTDEGIG